MGPEGAADPDVAAIAGEIELGDKNKDKAIAAWKQAQAARSGKKSARVLYGLARAEFLAGDTARAAADARAAIEASPQHAGSRVLLATIQWQSADQEAEAITTLKQVTE